MLKFVPPYAFVQSETSKISLNPEYLDGLNALLQRLIVMSFRLSTLRETGSLSAARQIRAASGAFNSIFTHGFPYSRFAEYFSKKHLHELTECYRKLSAHSCINAVAFSNTDGRFLASGGDGEQVQTFQIPAYVN